MVLGLLVAAAVGSRGDRGLAVQGGETVQFGPIGVAPSEAVRVNVYAANTGRISDPNDAQWDFVLRIFNRRGEIAQEQRLRLPPGSRVGRGQHWEPRHIPCRESRAANTSAEIVGFNPQPDPPGAYLATLEVYNRQTGGTSVIIGNPDIAPAAPQ